MKPNISGYPLRKVSPFRKVAIAQWSDTNDCQIYGAMDISMDPCLALIVSEREKGNKITVTHLIIKALAKAFEVCPEANAVIRWNQIFLRNTIDIFVNVAMKDPITGKIDLSGTKIESADKLSIIDIKDILRSKAEKIRKGKDAALEQTRRTMWQVPQLFLRPLLKVLIFILYILNIRLTKFGIPKDSFGSVILTNIGTLGLDEAYAPLVPISKCPIVICMGGIQEKPCAENGEIKIKKIMRLTATMDHRVIDGQHAAHLTRALREYLANPTLD